MTYHHHTSWLGEKLRRVSEGVSHSFLRTHAHTRTNRLSMHHIVKKLECLFWSSRWFDFFSQNVNKFFTLYIDFGGSNRYPTWLRETLIQNLMNCIVQQRKNYKFSSLNWVFLTLGSIFFPQFTQHVKKEDPHHKVKAKKKKKVDAAKRLKFCCWCWCRTTDYRCYVTL